MAYRLQQSEVSVPKNTGIEGFLHTVRELLKLRRIQSINIDSKGLVKYERYVEDGEVEKIGIDYEGLEPWHVVRNADVEELVTDVSNPLGVIAHMFDAVAAEKLYPTAFVSGANNILKEWIYAGTSGRTILKKDSLFGLPVLADRNCPETALILCGAFSRDAALVDTQKAFKVEMDIAFAPDTQVEVL